MNTLKTIFSAAVLALCASPSAFADQFIPANNGNITYTGRIDFSNPLSPRFTYPGVSAALNFEGTTLKMKAKPGSGYFMVEIDDRHPFKINFTETDTVLTLVNSLEPGAHTARISYAVEGYNYNPEFRGFYIDNDARLLDAPKRPERRIEFIGNSITCGYGIEGENGKEDFSFRTENHFYSYATLTARALNAEHVVVARSGYGIYRNYGGPKEGNPNCIPALYERTLFNDSTVMWDFNRFRPQVVCVNLGTNDVSLRVIDRERLTVAYRDFIKRLRGYYPEAKIVMLTGCMAFGDGLKALKETLDAVVKEANDNGDKNVYRFDMSQQDGTLGYGSDYHPSMRQAQKMADELIPYLRELMDWE